MLKFKKASVASADDTVEYQQQPDTIPQDPQCSTANRDDSSSQAQPQSPNTPSKSSRSTNHWSSFFKSKQFNLLSKAINDPKLKFGRTMIIRDTFNQRNQTGPWRDMLLLLYYLLIGYRLLSTVLFYIFLIMGLTIPYIAYYCDTEIATIVGVILWSITFLGINFIFQFLVNEVEEEEFKKLENERISELRRLTATPSDGRSQYLCTPARDESELAQFRGESSQASAPLNDGVEIVGTAVVPEENQSAELIPEYNWQHYICCGTWISRYTFTFFITVSVVLYIICGFITFNTMPYTFFTSTIFSYSWLFVFHYIIGLKKRCRMEKHLAKVWSCT